jgi:TolA-binding protein
VWRSLGAAQELTHASPATTATAADGAPKASPLGTTSHAAPPSAEAAPPSAEAAPPSAEAVPPPPRVDVAPSRLEAASRAQPASPIARTTNVAVALGGPAPAPGVPSAIASASASDLFDSANSARRVGDTALALARYDALERQFPESRESRLARATTGKLLLDRGDAVGALGRFDAYLASGAAELREEAMAGRATALERLGRDDEEARAWTALLASFPRTPYAAHARVRVGRSLPQ